MKRSKGFTLIEVLVAMAITAIAAVIAYSGLDSAMKMAESSQLEADRLQKMNRVFDILSKDFRHAIPRKVRSPDGDGFEDAFFYNEFSMPMLRFSRNGWVNPQPERFQRSHLQRVNYHYDGEKLTRYSWSMMDRYDDSEPNEFVLLENVTAFTVRMMKLESSIQNNVPINKGVWIESWPEVPAGSTDVLEGSETLPMAVEINIQLEGWGEIRRVFEFVDDGV